MNSENLLVEIEKSPRYIRGNKSLEIRKKFNVEMEKLRKEKIAKRNEEVFCSIFIEDPKTIWEVKDMRELLKCARVRIFKGEERTELMNASFEKWQECPRCRRYFDQLYNEAGMGMVCERCDRVLHIQDYDSQKLIKP